ncbi:HmuY family protein [Flavobacteriaceae bacterium MHTCC 0001]
MKTLKFLTLLALFIGFSSCSNDDDEQPLAAIVASTFENLSAPQSGGQGQPVAGDFTKFDFESGQTTTSTTDWDIAFRGTTIIVNGGESTGATDEPERNGNAAAYIANNTFDAVTEISTNNFNQDAAAGLAIPTGSGNGWYTYTGPPNHLIVPTAGKILVFRTRDGKYAKVEILSYYKDAPSEPDTFTDESRHYTFNYVYQPNEGVSSFKI